MTHLDTSFLIRALVRGSPEDSRLRGWLREGEPVGMSTIAWAEFLCGPLTPDAVEVAELVVGDPVPFASNEALLSAELFNNSGRRRGSLVDCMIAAIAIGQDAELATANTSDFRRLVKLGLRLA